MTQLQCPVCGAIRNQERIFEDRVIYKPASTGSRRSEVQKIVYWHCLNCGRDYSSSIHEDGSIHRPLVDAPSDSTPYLDDKLINSGRTSLSNL